MRSPGRAWRRAQTNALIKRVGESMSLPPWILTTPKEAAMSEAIKAGDIPHDIQRDVIQQAASLAADIARQAGDGDAKKAARAVVEAGVLAWQVLNGVTR